ncbi:MAG: B12-binding domain-containing radical SAM protein [Lachnospiraceae bacterium]|nr:B12-binding domain-containing radical SAM protein [Lachnospiraceae bacterium]
MKFLLAAINAKYIHANLAVYSLSAYVRKKQPKAQIELCEYTINHRAEQILQDIYRRKPDVVGFSCYIWNITYVQELVKDLLKVSPKTEIWLGGPEVSWSAREALEKEPGLRGILRGEGEESLSRLVAAYLAAEEHKAPLSHAAFKEIPGITFCTPKGEVSENPPAPLLAMDELPFPYENLDGFENRILYYESSRGCPFSCSYCLSSLDKSVRFRSLSLVERELKIFLDKRVGQVKFVDRTFNCKKEHTLGIWRYLLAHDNGITNFHFEVSADLFGEEELSLISAMRPGLIQLEIGVQSTNPRTLTEIRRKTDLAALKMSVNRIHAFGNTHQHLDLIAGLPCEGMESFLNSFNEVHSMHPDQLQLGFLKVLKGSYMAKQTECYGLKHRTLPPYEVLETRWLSFDELIRLKEMEEMVEVYYNSGQFKQTMRLLLNRFAKASDLYLALSEYYRNQGLFAVSHSRLSRYEILYRFVCGLLGAEPARFRDALLYDLYLRENIKSRPSFASDQTPYKKEIRAFFEAEAACPVWLFGYEGYEARQLAKMAHLEIMEDGSRVLFDYKNRNPLSHNARTVRLPKSAKEEKHDRFLCGR